MAKRSLFGNLFNENGLIQAAIDGAAIGLGGPDRRKEAMVEAEKRRKEQMAAVEAGDKASREAAKARATAAQNTPPPMVNPDLPTIDNDLAALLGMPQNTENMPVEGENVAGVQSLASANNPSLFGDTAVNPEGAMQLPTPPPDPLEQADSYLRELKGAPLSMEGQQKLIRLRQIRERADSPELLPSQQAELMDQFFQEQERLKVEDDIEQPPTVESETALRVQQAPNGMQTIMQPDGRIDVKDPTTKAELKQIELQAKAQEAEIQQKTQISQMREQRRAEQMQVRQQEMAEKKKAEARVAEEKATRFKDHWSKAIEKVPMSTRYEEARKELEAQFKSLNPKLPMRKFSPAEIRALAESKIAMDFMANERFAEAPMSSPKLSPVDRLKQLAKEDPDEFNNQVQMVMDENEGMTRAAAIKELAKRTPESLEAEIDSVFAMEDGPSTDPAGQAGFGPSGLDMFANGQDMQKPEGFLKGLFQRQAAPAQEPAPEPVAPEPPSPSDVQAPPNPLRGETAPIQEVESLLSDRIGSPVKFADVVDTETLDYLKESGSKNPIEDAAVEITKALRTGAENINLMSTMEREGAKYAFPLATDDSDEALDKLGVKPGEIYRDGFGNLKEREVKTKPKTEPKRRRLHKPGA
jgi:hypothetical protein